MFRGDIYLFIFLPYRLFPYIVWLLVLCSYVLPECLNGCVSVSICIFVLFFGPFCFCLFVLSCFDLSVTVLTYSIPFNYYSVDACLFCDKRQNGCGFSWNERPGGSEELGKGKQSLEYIV